MITVEEALEGSTPLANKVRGRGPFHSPDEVVAAMRAAVPTLSEEETIATLNAHPRIGANPKRLSARSLREQGEDALPELEQLNAEYERQFGFRFVVFVNRRKKAEILEVLRQRLTHSREEELQAGLQAIIDIAQDRLHS